MADVPVGGVDLRRRQFVKELDFSREEFLYLIELAAELKAAAKQGGETRYLHGKKIVLILRHWGIAECSRCERTIVLGEQLRRRGGKALCQECMCAPCERTTRTAAPVCLRHPAVRQVREGEPSRAA